ncbi:SH2 domain-containing protein [Fluoribacter gormanii]|uniref:SH2 domain-containing protein n=1 Tax=Fluoribacter gormanii TaxID=464 RepID=UPI002244C7C8|nr:SH2 domain-containing protein [Fluoribacter gormanii]MCW8472256.1 SH2 domain-containing protein [Fluoribacter gormanii]
MQEKYLSYPPCYYDIDRMEAEKRLSNMPIRTFILRPSSQKDAIAALSIVVRGRNNQIKVAHFLVTQNPADDRTLILQNHQGIYKDLKTMVNSLSMRYWIPFNQIEAVKGKDKLPGCSLLSLTWKQLELNEEQIKNALKGKEVGTFIFSLGKENGQYPWIMSVKITNSTNLDFGIYIKKNGFCEKPLPHLLSSRPVIEIPKSLGEIIALNAGEYFADEVTYNYSKGELISLPIFIEPFRLKRTTVEGYIESIETGGLDHIKQLFETLSKIQKRALLKFPFYIHSNSVERNFVQGYTAKPIDLASSQEIKDFLIKEEEKVNNLTPNALMGLFKQYALPKDLAQHIAGYLDFTDGLHLSQTNREAHEATNPEAEENKPKH